MQKFTQKYQGKTVSQPVLAFFSVTLPVMFEVAHVADYQSVLLRHIRSPKRLYVS